MILVIGETGQLARSLEEADPSLTFWGRDRLDLTDAQAAEEAVAASGASLVINAAAYTSVDQAESEPDLAHAVNAEGAGALARGAARAGAGLVHISTDYVFDGTKQGEYTEDDPVDPLGAYGESKLAGEFAVMKANPRAIVLRTAWVYSPFGKNFVKTMLRLADRERLTVVADQQGKPTSALDLAEAILAIAPRLIASPAGDPAWSVFHYAGRGTTSWARFAEEIFAQATGRLIDRAPEVARITTADYPTPAKRPANSALDCSRFEAEFNIDTVPWRRALARVIDRLEQDAKGEESE
ncbi:MAG: dTDP-4-dehydrorhamnose reductase [Pseudomonadota bacterium]